MNETNKIEQKCLVFSKWTRKNYAIFVSLKRVVKMARLSVDVCISSFKKNSELVSITNTLCLNNISVKEEPDQEDNLLNSILLMLTELNIISIDKPCSIDIKNHKLIIQSPLDVMQST